MEPHPTEKYELWLQLVTGELSQGEAAERFGIDRSTVMRIRHGLSSGLQETSVANQTLPGWLRRRELNAVVGEFGHHLLV
jgi:hypothetical protein